MTEDNESENETTVEQPDEMTEQIDASFGPMNVYVSGTEHEDVLETFNDVWETMLETSDAMHERKQEMDDDESEDLSSRTFGD